MFVRWIILVLLCAATMEGLKTERKTAKSNVTRLRNNLSRALAEGSDIQSISDLVSKLKETFSKFSDAHDKVADQDKETDILVTDEYFSDVQDKYIDVLSKANTFLSERSKVQSSDTLPASDEALKLFALPKIELQVFSGGVPYVYPVFQS